MKNKLTFQFDPNQSYQLDAIESVVDLFEGVPFQNQQDMLSGTTEDVVANFPEDEPLDEFLLLDNLQMIQQRNNDEKKGSELEISDDLIVDDGMVMENTGYDSVRVPHFTVEMETGTGKSYVMLRSVHELSRRYGFTKFIIVVPSVAIYQGIVKSIEITKSHFRQLYDNQEISLIPYDSSRLSEVKTFATNTELTVMIMTIDAFNKASNNIYKHTEKLPGGWKPYQYIQATRPILILDEAQNFESDKAKESLRTLKPLFALRYSATHRETPNLVYRLTPIDAFRNNLVKQIEVVGVSELDNLNEKVLRLVEVTKKPITAVVKAMVLDKGELLERDIVLKQGDNLADKTRNPDYAGFDVAEIRYGKKEEEQFIRFENDKILSVVDSVLSKESIFRAMIERTVLEHMERQQELKDQGVKVLSLFFIDRVKNYTASDGVIKRLFDEAFEKLKHRYPDFEDKSAESVRKGYFAKKSQNDPDENAVDTEGRNQAQREMEKEAFELIMKSKERLLSFEEPVSFIFAHSALKEGWDNPNVCQICTLNQTSSTLKKRQEIGRGLRLLVDQEGKRLEDHTYNLLTVVANESYEAFVSRLQEEYVEDGVQAPPKPKKPEQGKVKRNEKLFNSKEFRDFWTKLNKRMTYSLSIDTEKLIEECVEKLNEAKFPNPLIEVSKGSFVLANYTISLLEIANDKSSAKIRVQMEDTQGNTQDTTLKVAEKDDLKKKIGNERLRGFKILRINEQYGEPFVKFDNEVVIKKYEPHRFTAEKAVKVQKRIVESEKTKYPIPDFISRVANETYLTKKTILEIFKRMSPGQKEKIFYNPEGWISEFLSQIRITVSDHIVENIDFEIIDENDVYDIEELFPQIVKHPQRELVPAGKAGLYDMMQVDSDVERGFISNQVIPDSDEDNTVLYFKFPPKFRIQLPKIIGNYNPDWAIVRKVEDGSLKLELVRETKGGVDLERLRFPKEKRKIQCAEKYFKKLGIGYRVVTDTTHDWYREDLKQLSFK
ncbi:TPA: type III restriction endonuclease subunit R [Salmonella enterica subsp. enterica serovar Typhimurium var. 5-]|uniref:Type III restriction endonuclease subunit R n=1 Tax=Salmonella enterica subsp. enterica serovar Typhimurium var. 5- TaxID=1620419 RepID=A0A740TT77_SALTM|nr:type III restriction endonuclease subunit R [Salmonella enterica subsp. enterica serovar Typhimurium var. 5-]